MPTRIVCVAGPDEGIRLRGRNHVPYRLANVLLLGAAPERQSTQLERQLQVAAAAGLAHGCVWQTAGQDDKQQGKRRCYCIEHVPQRLPNHLFIAFFLHSAVCVRDLLCSLSAVYPPPLSSKLAIPGHSVKPLSPRETREHRDPLLNV